MRSPFLPIAAALAVVSALRVPAPVRRLLAAPAVAVAARLLLVVVAGAAALDLARTLSELA